MDATSHHDSLLCGALGMPVLTVAIGRRREVALVGHSLALQKTGRVEGSLHGVEPPSHRSAIRHVRVVVDEVHLRPTVHCPPVDDALACVVGIAKPIGAQDAHRKVNVLASLRSLVDVVGAVVAELQVPHGVLLLGPVRPVHDQVRLPLPVVVGHHVGATARLALRLDAIGALALQDLEAHWPSRWAGRRTPCRRRTHNAMQQGREDQRPTAHGARNVGPGGRGGACLA
mmetsp:Transcript_26362/g.53400  ORF Transcript_26362/g.53400 Transcript_26362/m.53400 type:complete len:229 (+) Transcript_26362:136-822(+)